MFFTIAVTYPHLSLKIHHGFNLTQAATYTSTQATQPQSIPVNLVLRFGHMSVDLETRFTRGITLNTGVIASLTAFGAVVKIVATAKKYDKKGEREAFARVEYKKILDAIRFHLRGEPFDQEGFLTSSK